MRFGKIILGVLFMLAFAFKGYSQRIIRMPVRRLPIERPINQPGVRLQRVKENYIGNRLKLNADESRAFWPIYRQYVQDQTAVRILKRQNISKVAPDGTSQIDKDLAYDTQLLNIKKHYKDEFLKVLPPEKVSELYKSERDFNDEAVRILSEQGVAHPVN